MDTEQATNRLLFALSQHPGMTTAQLVEFLGLNKEQKKQVVQLLRGSGFAIEDDKQSCSGVEIEGIRAKQPQGQRITGADQVRLCRIALSRIPRIPRFLDSRGRC